MGFFRNQSQGPFERGFSEASSAPLPLASVSLWHDFFSDNSSTFGRGHLLSGLLPFFLPRMAVHRPGCQWGCDTWHEPGHPTAGELTEPGGCLLPGGREPCLLRGLTFLADQAAPSPSWDTQVGRVSVRRCAGAGWRWGTAFQVGPICGGAPGAWHSSGEFAEAAAQGCSG